MNQIAKEIGASAEQIVAVRNFVRNYEPTRLEEIVEHMPESLHIDSMMVKLSLAGIYRGDI